MSLLDRRPILSSSPPPQKRQKMGEPSVITLGYDSQNDSGDDLFDGIIPDTPRPFETQPTQIVDRGFPPRGVPSSPVQAPGSIVQVPASSPYNGPIVSPQPAKRTFDQFKEQSSHFAAARQNNIVSLMAPAGTAYKAPHGIVSRPAPTKSAVIDLVGPIAEDDMKSLFGSSDDEDEISERGDIKPSTFTTSATSPHASFGSTISRFAYNKNQMRPERAQPVGALSLTDEQIRTATGNVIKVVGEDVGYWHAREAVLKYKGDWERAILELTATEVKPKSTSTIDLTREDSSTLQMKRTLAGPTQSLRDKYSSTQGQTQSGEKHFDLNPQKPKRKLMQGRRDPAPSSPLAGPSPVPSPVKAKVVPPPPPVNYDSYETDSGNESVEEDDPEMEAECLEFFNTAGVRDLIDMTNTTQELAEAVIAARPFRNLDKARAVENPKLTKSGKKSKRGPIGEKIVDTAMQMMSGYRAVDSLVKACDEIAKPIRAEMSTWGLRGLSGGEFELTSFEDDIDSGIGSPRSATPSTKGDDDVDVKAVRRRAFNYLKKPELMAEDCVLKDYQVVGLNWLAMMYRQKNSCILADEMGLGKTCQVIAFLSHLVEIGQTGPHLVVCPGSTLENWSRELRRFAPNLKIELYWGGQNDRAGIAEEIFANRANINVLVTTYDMAYKPSDNKVLRQLQPDVCVYDEGHLLKNPKAKRYTSLIKIPATQKLLLTGTPLQNNLQELAALLAFIMPKVFKTLESELEYIFKSKATTRDADHAALLSAQRIERAKSMLTPFVLRRKKTQVLKHMPAKTNRIEYCTIHQDQKKIYNAHIEDAKERARLRTEGRILKTDEGNPLMQLRKAAIHPLLFRRHFTDEKIEKMADLLRRKEPKEFNPNEQRKFLIQEMHSFNDFALHQWCLQYGCIADYRLNDAAWLHSGKVVALLNLIKQYKKNGDRVLVFSQFTLVLDILEAVLNDSLIAFSRIDGGTPIDQRQSLIDNFTNDPSITAFLLTTKAGGTGINLASANKVIIFDMSFNPQDDKQAENRAHRVGQTREVEVVCFVTKDTIEEQIWALGQSKLKLDGRVAGEEGTGDDEEAGEKAIAKSFLEANSGPKSEVAVEEDEKKDDEQKKKERGGALRSSSSQSQSQSQKRQSKIIGFAK